mgnify:CR=1 FL=1
MESITAPGIAQVKLIDATPIGINVRSTVATYANVHDELRKIYARSPLAREKGYKAGDFSYNTGRLRCPGCDGTGTISLDIQFLPDVEITCPDCGGRGYVIRQQRTPFGVMQTQQPCSRCGGKGKLVKNPARSAMAAARWPPKERWRCPSPWASTTTRALHCAAWAMPVPTAALR